MEDISEGQTRFVAEVWVAQQFLEKGLSDGLSGADPEPLRSSVPGYYLTVHILGGLPVQPGQKKKTSDLEELRCVGSLGLFRVHP